jgi:hypothetical protein
MNYGDGLDFLENPISQIQLFVLADTHSVVNDPIYCSLVCTNLEAAPAYCAISYTWGPERPICTIWIGGRPFAVRQICSFTLLQARQYFASPLCCIGIDSICNDQDACRRSRHRLLSWATYRPQLLESLPVSARPMTPALTSRSYWRAALLTYSQTKNKPALAI